MSEYPNEEHVTYWEESLRYWRNTRWVNAVIFLMQACITVTAFWVPYLLILQCYSIHVSYRLWKGQREGLALAKVNYERILDDKYQWVKEMERRLS